MERKLITTPSGIAIPMIVVPILRNTEMSSWFTSFTPESDRQESFLERVTEAVAKQKAPFCKTEFDVGKTDKGTIVFEEGYHPATTVYSEEQWLRFVKDLYPEKRTRVLSPTEYDAYLAYVVWVAISEYHVDPYKAVFDIAEDSRAIGPYFGAREEGWHFPKTGEYTPYCGFHDIGGPYKWVHDPEHPELIIQCGGYLGDPSRLPVARRCTIEGGGANTHYVPIIGCDAD